MKKTEPTIQQLEAGRNLLHEGIADEGLRIIVEHGFGDLTNIPALNRKLAEVLAGPCGRSHAEALLKAAIALGATEACLKKMRRDAANAN